MKVVAVDGTPNQIKPIGLKVASLFSLAPGGEDAPHLAEAEYDLPCVAAMCSRECSLSPTAQKNRFIAGFTTGRLLAPFSKSEVLKLYLPAGISGVP